MAITLAPAAPVTQEAVGSVSAAGPGAQTYEQITAGLKANPPAEATPEVPEETPEAPAATPETEPAATSAEAQEELRTMTDEEIAALAPELQKEAKALRKRFQSAYTKKTMDLAEIRRKADIVDRFDSDPEFRAQVIKHVQAQTPQGTPQAPATPAPTAGPPQALVEMARQSLPPEMQWMAESYAKFGMQLVQSIQQGLVAPVQQQMNSLQQQRQEMEYMNVLGDFAERNPGWEAKEDDMVSVLEFLKSPKLTDARWGSKHDLLYRLAQGDKLEANAVQKTIEKTAQAVRSRSITSSGAGRSTKSNLEDRIRDRGISNDKAWDLIKQQVGSG